MSGVADDVMEALLALPGDVLYEQVGRHLKKYGIDSMSAWTDASKHKERLAHRLARLGHADALELLISARADANVQRESDGCTPLHLALWMGQPATADRLKNLGARQDIANTFGETALVAEAHRDERYVCWHQQADLLLNVAPLMLRRLFLERWAGYAGPMSAPDIGTTILQGSRERRAVGSTASVRRGQRCVTFDEDLRGEISKGQRLWIKDVEVEAAGEPEWEEGAGRWLGGGKLRLTASWPAADVRKASLEVPRLPAELSLPPGHDAYSKIRSGRVENWDTTILAHFCGADQCKLACSLVPEVDHRRLIRDLKDIRNKAALHLGRTEVEREKVNATADLVQTICDLLVPSMSDELRSMIDKTRGKTVIQESMLRQMEQRIIEEKERAEQMEERLQNASKFRRHVPPGAFADDSDGFYTDATADGSQSEWSASRVSSAWIPIGGVFCVCENIEDVMAAITLPSGCKPEVVLRCLSLALPCPREKNLLIVIRTGDTKVDDVMLHEVSASDVHLKWKERHTDVFSVETSPEVWRDWCLQDGVLVSGEQGRVLRVSAQFRPPEGRWRVKGPALRRALNIASAVEAVVIVSELGVLYASTTTHAQHGEYVQLRPDDGSDYDEEDGATLFSSRYTSTEVGQERGPSSTAQMVGDFFRPHERGRGQVTQTLLPQAAEQARHWGDGSAPITAGNAEQVSDNTSKWIWHMFGQSSREEAMDALSCGTDVLNRLASLGFEAYLARLLLPMGEFRRAWGQMGEAEDLFKRCRKLANEHGDFENGYSAHMSLFNLYVQLEKLPLANAVLIGAQRLVDKERENRTGPGMEDFIHAKQVFLWGNNARLDAKQALTSKDPAALLKAHELLAKIDREMSKMDENSSFRGNTDANRAELLNLWYIISMARTDTATARIAAEKELPLRRAQVMGVSSGGEMVCNSKLANVLVNLGRVLIALGEHGAAETILSEAQDVAQGLMSARNPPKHIMASVHRLRARCLEHEGDFNAACVHLQRCLELDDDSAVDMLKQLKLREKRAGQRGERKRNDAEVKAKQVTVESPDDDVDSRSIEQLAAFVSGDVGKIGKKSKKSKQSKMAQIKEEEGDAGDVVQAEEIPKDKEPKEAAREEGQPATTVEGRGHVLGEDDDEQEANDDGAEKAKKKRKNGKKKK